MKSLNRKKIFVNKLKTNRIEILLNLKTYNLNGIKKLSDMHVMNVLNDDTVKRNH